MWCGRQTCTIVLLLHTWISSFPKQPTTVRKLLGKTKPNLKCSWYNIKQILEPGQNCYIVLNILGVRWKSATPTARQTKISVEIQIKQSTMTLWWQAHFLYLPNRRHRWTTLHFLIRLNSQQWYWSMFCCMINCLRLSLRTGHITRHIHLDHLSCYNTCWNEWSIACHYAQDISHGTDISTIWAVLILAGTD